MATSVTGVQASLRRLKRVPPDIIRGGSFVRAVRVIVEFDLANEEIDTSYQIETFGGDNPPPQSFDAVIEPVFALPVALDYRVKGNQGNVEGDGGASQLPDLTDDQLDSILREVEGHIESQVFARQRTRETQSVADDRVESAARGTAFNPVQLGAKEV